MLIKITQTSVTVGGKENIDGAEGSVFPRDYEDHHASSLACFGSNPVLPEKLL